MNFNRYDTFSYTATSVDMTSMHISLYLREFKFLELFVIQTIVNPINVSKKHFSLPKFVCKQRTFTK